MSFWYWRRPRRMRMMNRVSRIFLLSLLDLFDFMICYTFSAVFYYYSRLMRSYYFCLSTITFFSCFFCLLTFSFSSLSMRSFSNRRSSSACCSGVSTILGYSFLGGDFCFLRRCSLLKSKLKISFFGCSSC